MLYDYFPGHGFFLINVAYYESQQWLLLNQRDGKEQSIVAPPGYSPGRKWLASVYATEGPDDGNNGIDIIPTSVGTADPAFRYRPEEYEMWEYVGWDGDDRLLLKVTWYAVNDRELATWSAEVILSDGKWQLNKWPPGVSRP
jgi:hypothetical protein